MAELQNVEVTTPSGVKTTFRVSADKVERYKAMGKEAQAAAKAETKERTPRAEADVKNK